jgi:hypothetical protein
MRMPADSKAAIEGDTFMPAPVGATMLTDTASFPVAISWSLRTQHARAPGLSRAAAQIVRMRETACKLPLCSAARPRAPPLQQQRRRCDGGGRHGVPDPFRGGGGRKWPLQQKERKEPTEVEVTWTAGSQSGGVHSCTRCHRPTTRPAPPHRTDSWSDVSAMRGVTTTVIIVVGCFIEPVPRGQAHELTTSRAANEQSEAALLHWTTAQIRQTRFVRRVGGGGDTCCPGPPRSWLLTLGLITRPARRLAPAAATQLRSYAATQLRSYAATQLRRRLRAPRAVAAARRAAAAALCPPIAHAS